MKKKTKKDEFKDRYELATGYPWLLGDSPTKGRIIAVKDTIVGGDFKTINYPRELWSNKCPLYKLVLEKINFSDPYPRR